MMRSGSSGASLDAAGGTHEAVDVPDLVEALRRSQAQDAGHVGEPVRARRGALVEVGAELEARRSEEARSVPQLGLVRPRSTRATTDWAVRARRASWR